MRSFKSPTKLLAAAVSAAVLTAGPAGDFAPKALASEAAAPAATHRYYTVAEVLTGDTFKLTTGTVVAYASIAAPPMVDEDPKVREYGRQSTEFNRGLLTGKRIRVECGSQIKNADGHYQGFVFLEDGTFANLKMIEAGFAKLNITPPNLQHAEVLRRASTHARRDGSGLWEHENTLDRKFIFIGDKMTKKFHFAGCDELDRVSKAHLERFDSSVGAKAAGYAFCKMCRHTYAQETDLF